MTDPFKLKLAKAVTAGLKTITPGNGYQSNLADYDPGDGAMVARVYRGRAFFGDGDPIPMVSILEGGFEDETLNEQVAERPVSEYWWPLLLQGWVQDDPDNPTDPAYILLADVRKYLAAQMKRKGSDGYNAPFGVSGIQQIRFGGGRVRPSSEMSAYAGFHLILELRIVDRADAAYD